MQRTSSMISSGYSDDMAMDAEICNMLGSLSLKGWQVDQEHNHILQVNQPSSSIPSGSEIRRSHSESGSDSGDSCMMEITDASGNIQFISSSEMPKQSPPQEQLGCGLVYMLRQFFGTDVRQQQSSESLNTQDRFGSATATETSAPPFDFLDTVLTHREAFVAFPQGHRTCSKALTELGSELEKRHAKTHADGDLDWAIALHNEAWLMSGWYST